jgi:hypothetical protein
LSTVLALALALVALLEPLQVLHLLLSLSSLDCRRRDRCADRVGWRARRPTWCLSPSRLRLGEAIVVTTP